MKIQESTKLRVIRFTNTTLMYSPVFGAALTVTFLVKILSSRFTFNVDSFLSLFAFKRFNYYHKT